MPSHHFNVKGKVIWEDDKNGIPDLRVELWDKELIIPKLVGSTFTNKDGTFEIDFDKKYLTEVLFERAPDLFFRIFRDDTLVRSTENKLWRNVKDENNEVQIEIGGSATSPSIFEPENRVEEITMNMQDKETKQEYTVTGKVLNAWGEGIESKTVMAYDVDLKGARVYKTAKTINELEASSGMQFLGKTISQPDGTYSISFNTNQYRAAERSLADVVVYAVTTPANNATVIVYEIIGISTMTKDSDYLEGVVQNLNIILFNSTERGISEYAKLIQALKPFAEESGLQLFQISDSDDQINFLAAETKQDKTNTTLAVQADKLRTDYPKQNFSAELFYGIGRQNIELEWNALLLKSSDALSKAIQKSIDLNYISAQDIKVIDAFIANLLEAAFQTSSKAPENADLFKTLGFTIQDPDLQKTFLKSYTQFNTQPSVFWDDLSKKDGFTPEIIQSLQLTNQLSILTGQNTALIGKLQVGRDIKDPSELLELSSDEWNTIINKTGVPNNIAGNTKEEKAGNYISGMQNLLNAAYPTKRIELMISDSKLHFDDGNVQEKVSAFFATAKNFDISTSRITDFDDSIKTVAGKMHDQVLQHIQKIQRIYQVSPTPEVMTTLIKKGYTSAYHISSISQNAFINMEAKDLGGTDTAFSVYNRARHQVMRAQHILLKVRDTQDKAIPAKIITRQQQQAISDYIQNL